MDGTSLGFASPDPDATAVTARLETLARDRFVERLWASDPALWAGDPGGQAVVRQGLGWLRAPQEMARALDGLRQLTDGARDAGIRQVLHMGMGGSSLAPLVLERTFPRGPGSPELTVLDTTDPATILADDRWAARASTLFIVASKSGTTAEPAAFGEYFYAKQRALVGDDAGAHFVAITDAGTPLERLARERRYRRSLANPSDVGGRYSALTYFGLLPAALAGIDVAALLERAARMADACRDPAPARNPGVHLGAIMGELARRGRDKITLLVAEPFAALGTWLEQLLAESTGKQGTGLLPVADEPAGEVDAYGADRLFIHLRARTGGSDLLDDRVEALRRAGHPIVTLEIGEPLELGPQFFQWEIATATAGSILRINAFDQPNVQESKDNTNRLLDVVRAEGRLPEPPPSQIDGPLALYAEATGPDAAATLARFFDSPPPRGYIALLAYLTEADATYSRLQSIRVGLRNTTRLATTLGYGPRYLHSTGQYHKGGPATGLFVVITADDTEDAAIPGQPYTFGVFKRAQALGDLEALRRHGQRALRVHLRGPVDQALERLDEILVAAS